MNNSYEKEARLHKILESYTIKEDYDIIKGNLVDNNILKKVSHELDIIFHLAAHANVRYSINHANTFSNNNIISTINILELALNLNLDKIIYSSSSSVYGNPLYTPVDEDHPKNPISPYGISKLCCELYADYYYREYNLPITSLRFYTVYGPHGRTDMAIGKFFNFIIQNKKIKIFGNGEQLRDFTYVGDIVDGLILAAENKNSNGEVFNLGTSNTVSVNELVNKMYKIANKPKNVQYVEKKQGDVNITFSKIEKAQKILDFNPKFNIDEGLEKTYKWQIKYLNKGI